MAYTVLARKYRSQSFGDVVGQDAVAQTLENAIKTGRVAHAYLFCGTRGIGKTTVARILAKALNCLQADGPTTAPCCACESCVAINTGEDIDVLEIDGASNNGVDQVRELRDNAIYRPARSRYKIYIIDEVHMLSVAAFNALLKILEEPPAHVKFIFATTEPNKVLATIQSRCQRFDFRNISPADITRQLKTVLQQEDIAYEDDLILALAKMANGSMRDGLSLLDRLISTGISPLGTHLLEEFLGLPNVDRIYHLVDVMGSRDAAGTLNALDGLITSGLSEAQIVDALIDNLRDIMVIKTAGQQDNLLILTAEQMKRAQDLAEKYDAAGLIYAITTLEKLRWAIRNSDTPRTLLEASALRFALSEHFMNLDELIGRLNSSQPAPPKKKQVDATRPEQETSPRISPASVSCAAKPASALDLGFIQTNWDAILDRLTDTLGPATVGLLHRATPLELSDSVLSIQLPSGAQIQKEMCESRDRKTQIQQALSAALSATVELAFVLADSEAKGASDDHQSLKRKRQALLNDPAVRTVLMGLNATVANIEDQ